MASKTIGAWTEASGKSYPEYINFSREGGEAVVVLRGAPFQGVNGNTASVRLPWEQVVAMCERVLSEATAEYRQPSSLGWQVS